MRAKEIRKQTLEGLNKKIQELGAKLNEAKYDLRIGVEKNTAVIKKLKLQIARAKTVLNEGTFAKADSKTK